MKNFKLLATLILLITSYTYNTFAASNNPTTSPRALVPITATSEPLAKQAPFDCTTCGRRFTQKGNLTVHMHTHTGKQPFACTICDRKLTRKDSLTKHMRTHTRKGKRVKSVPADLPNSRASSFVESGSRSQAPVTAPPMTIIPTSTVTSAGGNEGKEENLVIDNQTDSASLETISLPWIRCNNLFCKNLILLPREIWQTNDQHPKLMAIKNFIDSGAPITCENYALYVNPAQTLQENFIHCKKLTCTFGLNAICCNNEYCINPRYVADGELYKHYAQNMQWTCNDIGYTCVTKMPELRTDQKSEVNISDEEFAAFLRSIEDGQSGI